MTKNEIRQKIDEMVDYLVGELKRKLGYRLESVTLTGSYAIGKVSEERPDINMILFFKGVMLPDDSVELGRILNGTIEKFKGDFGVRLEFRPFRFVYPRYKKEPEVFVNPLILNMAEKDLEFPFNIPHYILAGMAGMRKVVFGTDVLASVDLEVTKGRIIGGAFRVLPLGKLQLDRAPIAYDVDKESDLLFSEALSIGKLTSYDGVEIAMSDDEIKQKKYMGIITDKSKLINFYRERYDAEAAEFISVILQARDNCRTWKNDPDKAIIVYRAASGIWQKIWMKLLSMAREM